MRIQKLKIPFLLAAAVLVTRLPFMSRLLYNMDSVQFALGTEKFDVALHQPHPPGYYLYVWLGRLARLVINDANTALVGLSILFSALAVVMIYFIGRKMFDEDTGLVAAVIALTSPLFWFHGEVALSYMPEAFMSVLVAYLCYSMLLGEKRFFWLAAVALGMAGGIRQNTMVFLMPLWLFSMKDLGLRRICLSLLIFGAVVLSWFVPMLAETGGYARYSAALSAHWVHAAWHGLNWEFLAYNAGNLSHFLVNALAFSMGPIFLLLYTAIREKRKLEIRPFSALFFAFWLLPAFLFHLVVHTHPAAPGYALIYAVGLFVLAAKSMLVFSRRLAENLPGLSSATAAKALLVFIVAGNCFIFIFWDAPSSLKAIRFHDRVLASYIDAVKNNFSPADTEIIGSDRFLYSYRHAMYYLPEYRVHNNVLITTPPDGPQLFWGQHRQTYRSRCITLLPGTRRYVDFFNYSPEDKATLPAGARFIPFKDGFLVYYDNLGDLYKVERIRPFLAPSRRVDIP